MEDHEITAELLDVPPGEDSRHFEQAAMLILKRRNWSSSPDDRINIVELRKGYRVDVMGCEVGKPVRYATYHERKPASAVRLANEIQVALSLRAGEPWPINVIRLGARP